MVVWAIARPCSPIIAARSRELNLKLKYQRTHRTTISWSKCRPLKSSSTGTNCDICLSSPTGIHVCTRAIWRVSGRPKAELTLTHTKLRPHDDKLSSLQHG